jgi:hypothetical protein
MSRRETKKDDCAVSLRLQILAAKREQHGAEGIDRDGGLADLREPGRRA